MKRSLVILLALVGLLSTWAAPSRLAAQVQLTTKGDNFWFGFMDNSIERAKPNLWVFLSVPLPDNGAPVPTEPVTVYLNIPGIGLKDEFQVNYGQTFTVVFPTTDRGSDGRPVGLPANNKGINKLYPIGLVDRIMNVQTGVPQKNAINVQSTDDINLFILNQRPFTTDATIVYPTGVQASDYTVQAYDEVRTSEGGDPSDPTNVRVDWVSELMIVASVASEITIESPALDVLQRRVPGVQSIRLRDGQILIPGQKLVINLEAGETYLLQSSQDLTGCHIYIDGGGVCSGFALFGGNQCTTMGDCAACDHVVEMVLPRRDASTSYILTGTRRRQQEIYRVTGISDNTTVTLHTNPPQTRTINEGEFTNFRIRTAFGTSGPGEAAYMITGDKPFLVTQNGLGLYCDQDNWESGYGDPYMLLMPGADLMIAKSAAVLLIDFPPSRQNANPARRKKWEHFVNILTKTELVDYIRINGSSDFTNYWLNGNPVMPIKDNFKPVEGFPEYSWTSIIYDINQMSSQDESLQLKITMEDPTGQREFGLTDGFAAYVVGYNNFDSYGYTAAVGMNQVARMESSEFKREHNPCHNNTKGEFWFRIKGGFTQKADIPTDPEDPSQTINEDSYKFRIVNKTTGDEAPATVYFVSGFGDNRVEGYPSGLIVRVVGLPAGSYQLIIEDYDIPVPCENRLDFEIEEPGEPISAIPNQFCYVPDKDVSIEALGDSGIWCPMPGISFDGQTDPNFNVVFNPDAGRTGGFNTNQFADVGFRDALTFKVKYVSPTWQQSNATPAEIPTCQNGCPTEVEVLLRQTPEVDFWAAEAETEYDEEEDVLLYNDPDHMRNFRFRLDNRTNDEGMRLRYTWRYVRDDAPGDTIDFIPADPNNPTFQLEEFLNPPNNKERVSYTIILKAITEENGCEDTAHKTVAIQYPNVIYFPNVFTPNGDGKNDVFRPFQTEGINEYLIIIYDRWGMEQFRSEDTTKHWDGTVNGRGEALESEYFWYAKYKSIAGVETIRTGRVTLIR